jgi:RNA polymerase-binding transcription factor DksA
VIKCLKCDKEFENYKRLSAHIKREHRQTSKEYIIENIGYGKCKECGDKTNFKNLNIGFRKFYSNVECGD